jgi:hypothetical protein
MIGDLQQQPHQVGVVALGDFSFGGTPRAPSYDFQGKKPKL